MGFKSCKCFSCRIKTPETHWSPEPRYNSRPEITAQEIANAANMRRTEPPVNLQSMEEIKDINFHTSVHISLQTKGLLSSARNDQKKGFSMEFYILN